MGGEPKEVAGQKMNSDDPGSNIKLTCKYGGTVFATTTVGTAVGTGASYLGLKAGGATIHLLSTALKIGGSVGGIAGLMIGVALVCAMRYSRDPACEPLMANTP